MNFLKSFFAAVLGTLFGLALFMILLGFVFGGIAALGENVPVQIGANSVLELRLNRPLQDRASAIEEFSSALGLKEGPQGLNTLLKAIGAAKTDDRIKGISLHAATPQAGWAQLYELREALTDFKASGKWLYTHADFYSQKGYYLSSVADQVFLHPLGNLELKGLATEVLYYKDFQKRFGIEMEVVRLGKYKSAVEPYLNATMSAENKEQISALLASLWEHISTAISENRNLTPSIVEKIVANLGAQQPEVALDQEIIDGLLDESDYEAFLEEQLPNFDRVDATAYGNQVDTSSANRIAVLYAQGPILYGEGGETFIGQDAMLEAIEDIIAHPMIKAVVLRVDSPGGVALTSDIIWAQLQRIPEHKPLVVSMGNVAASGGYYIALPGQQLVATPLSITGSIGAFATIPNIKKLTADLGINAEQVSTHPNALGYSPFSALSTGVKTQIRKGLETTYSTFKSRVAQGRKMDEDTVEALAQGRVWSGAQAKANGLIDSFGGLTTAVAKAAEAANLENYTTVAYPKWTPDLNRYLASVLSGVQLQLPLHLFEALLPASNTANPPVTPQNQPHVQTALPFQLNIN